MEKYLEELRKSGLTGNEAKIYLTLLRRGSLPASEICKKASMDRTLTYSILNNLIEKGLVSYIVQKGKKYFESTSPQNLLNPIKEKSAFIKELIPELENLEKIKEITQEIQTFEGKSGLRSFLSILMKHKHVDSFGATGRAYDLFYESPRVAKELVRRGCSGRLITAPTHKKHPMKIKKFQMRFLDLKSEATTTIFGDYVGIHLIKDKPIAILIKNKFIAQSYRNHFEVLWSVAKS